MTTERIFVASRARTLAERDAARASITAYLYHGWVITSWGTAPRGAFEGMTGFYVSRVESHSGPGFGAQALRDRLASGLWASVEVTA